MRSALAILTALLLSGCAAEREPLQDPPWTRGELIAALEEPRLLDGGLVLSAPGWTQRRVVILTERWRSVALAELDRAWATPEHQALLAEIRQHGQRAEPPWLDCVPATRSLVLALYRLEPTAQQAPAAGLVRWLQPPDGSSTELPIAAWQGHALVWWLDAAGRLRFYEPQTGREVEPAASIVRRIGIITD